MSYAENVWRIEDVIAAAAEDDVEITREQAVQWWEKNEARFAEQLVAHGMEMLDTFNWEAEVEKLEDRDDPVLYSATFMYLNGENASYLYNTEDEAKEMIDQVLSDLSDDTTCHTKLPNGATLTYTGNDMIMTLVIPVYQ